MILKENILEPVSIEKLNNDEYQWRSNSAESFFLIKDTSCLAGKWVHIHLKIISSLQSSSSLSLYFDLGYGFLSDNFFRAYPDKNGIISFSYRIPEEVISIKIIPLDNVADFSIENFSVRVIPKSLLLLSSMCKVSKHLPKNFTYKINAVRRLYKIGGFRAVASRIINKSNAFVHNSNDINTPSLERLAALEQYVQDGFNRSNSKVTWSSQYVPKALDFLNHEELPIKTIAFYLPQFHPFPENDEWWGKGFTEWTNVSKTQPQYLGHHQPRLPGELGFYDLRLPEVMKQQAELARQYGIHGFCFHHYWFDGKRLMELPVNNLLADPTIDINFCLCWANENWSRRWDGSESDILIAQNHSAEDDIAFFEDILPALKDPRYIKVNDKPVLILYRATLMPDAAESAKRWRELAIQHGLPGLYLVVARSFDITDPRPFGFDAAVEFPPHQVSVEEITYKKTIINQSFEGRIYDYASLAKKYGAIIEKDFTNFKTVMPSWDNEARKPGKGHIFDGATPESYAYWLASAAKTTLLNSNDKRLLFINAWNEWAEGAALEPDRHYGYAYLQATASVLRNLLVDELKDKVADENSTFLPQSKNAIILHLYYQDMFDEILEKYLLDLKYDCDFIFTIPPFFCLNNIKKIKSLLPNSYFVLAENKGRDIRPFIFALKVANDFGYEFLCKLHTKRSPRLKEGDLWREKLFSSLIPSREGVGQIINDFTTDNKLGLICPVNSLTDLSNQDTHIDNTNWLNILLPKLGCSSLIGNYKAEFPAGSMFWFRADALRILTDPVFINPDDFELEAGQLDSTLAHSIERIICLLVERAGYRYQEIK